MKHKHIFIMPIFFSFLTTMLVTIIESRIIDRTGTLSFQEMKNKYTKTYYSPMSDLLSERHIRHRRDENEDLETAETVAFRPLFRHRQIVEERERRKQAAKRRRQERRVRNRNRQFMFDNSQN